MGRRRPLLTVVDLDVPLPRSGLDLRTEGLWASAVLETPMEHWTVGLEAFGVTLDDPAEAWRSGWGDRAALGLDLEWETTGAPVSFQGGYHVPCEVHGEVLVDDETMTVAGWGARAHAWGERGWWARSWCASEGRFDDGTTWYVSLGTTEAAGEGATLPGPVTLVLPDGVDVTVRPVHHAPVLLADDGGRSSQVARALCVANASDGRRGVGWTEWNRPVARQT